MALNGLFCADVPLSNYSLTPHPTFGGTCPPVPRGIYATGYNFIA